MAGIPPLEEIIFFTAGTRIFGTLGAEGVLDHRYARIENARFGHLSIPTMPLGIEIDVQENTGKKHVLHFTDMAEISQLLYAFNEQPIDGLNNKLCVVYVAGNGFADKGSVVGISASLATQRSYTYSMEHLKEKQ